MPIHCLFTAYSLPIHCLFTAYSLFLHCCFHCSAHCPIHCIHCFVDLSPLEAVVLTQSHFSRSDTLGGWLCHWYCAVHSTPVNPFLICYSLLHITYSLAIVFPILLRLTGLLTVYSRTVQLTGLNYTIGYSLDWTTHWITH
jgi:hypothetical protein